MDRKREREGEEKRKNEKGGRGGRKKIGRKVRAQRFCRVMKMVYNSH